MVLVEACNLLKKFGFKFKLELMGNFESKYFKKKLENYITKKGLKDYIEFLGVRTGDSKWEAYYEADNSADYDTVAYILCV